MSAITMKEWVIDHPQKDMGGMNLREGSLPPVGTNEVMVKFEAAALNYRDCAIAKVRLCQQTVFKSDIVRQS